MRGIWGRRGFVLLLVCGLALPVFAKRDKDKDDDDTSNDKDKKEKKVKPVEDTRLDETQKRKLRKIKAMFEKLYGLDGVPESAREEVRSEIYGALDAVHRPDRNKADKVANDLMASLRDQQLSAASSHRLVQNAAELLAIAPLSKEGVDNYLFHARETLENGSLPRDSAEQMRADLKQLFESAKVNQKYIDEREQLREQEELAKAEKEAKEKEEKEKREKRKAKSGGRKGGGVTGSGRKA